MLREALAGKGATDFQVESAGTGAWDGASASEGSYLVAIENNLDLSAHRARLLTDEIVAGADLILTMARHHGLRVGELGGEGKTFLLGEYSQGEPVEVSDPYGGDIEVYRDTYEDLARLMTGAVDRLLDDSQPE